MESGGIVLADYLGRLASGFESLFPAAQLRIEAGPDGLVLDIDRAIHVGLIVNELITNALKHAFPKGQPCEVVVALRLLGEHVQLQTRDNGRGLPGALDLERAKSLGLRTVCILAKRMNATVDIRNHDGAIFTITFPLEGEEPVEPRAE
jgi:two-component sensor histidine kinase